MVRGGAYVPSGYGVRFSSRTHQSNLAPICRSARDLELVVALLLGSELLHSLDPTSIPVPFKIPGLPKRKLRIGYYEQDGYFEAHSSCARAVRDTVATLASAGHEVWRRRFVIFCRVAVLVPYESSLSSMELYGVKVEGDQGCSAWRPHLIH